MKFGAKISRIIQGEQKLKAFADIYFEGGFRVSGVKVLNGENGLFIGMPSTSYTNANGDKKYVDVFRPITKEARQALTDEVVSKYEAVLSQVQEQSAAQSAPEPEIDEGYEELMDEPSM